MQRAFGEESSKSDQDRQVSQRKDNHSNTELVVEDVDDDDDSASSHVFKREATVMRKKSAQTASDL